LTGQKLKARAVVIGETDLSAQCAQLLQRRGHELVAVSSPEGSPLKEWSNSFGVPYVNDIGLVTEIARRTPVDYLFSIVNYRVLPGELLRLARLPINYHDGPLPRYAGVYATSWAILNNETQHGITWHMMTEKVDCGDILKQVSVAISPDDTVHSLNMKCYFAAYRGFVSLLQELEAGTMSRTPQDLTQRTYYGRSKWGSTLISWDWTASEIDRFCRALAFHPAHNPIGDPIAGLNGVPVYVRAAVPCAGSGKPIGTIVEVTEDYVQVATANDDVRLYGVRSLEGREWDLSPLKAAYQAGAEPFSHGPIRSARMHRSAG
jgi:polyketide synthase PksN